MTTTAVNSHSTYMSFRRAGASPSALPRAGMGAGTILVVDDDPDIRELIAQTLDDEGYHVIALGDGQRAIDVACHNPPALILLDLMMPKISGWEVMRMLRSQPETQQIPVVLISASRDLDAAIEQLGANARISKPFDLDQLIDTVRSYAGEPANAE